MSNVDRVKTTGYSMGGISDAGDTPSEVRVRGGFKKVVRNTGKGGR